LSLELLEDRLVPSASGIEPTFVLAPTPAHSAGGVNPLTIPAGFGYAPATIQQDWAAR
jgi:hypothetical protein